MTPGPFVERQYRCRSCGRDASGWTLLQQSPSQFLLQPHPMFAMAQAAFDHWLRVLREHFPDHPVAYRREFVPNVPEESERRRLPNLFLTLMAGIKARLVKLARHAVIAGTIGYQF